MVPYGKDAVKKAIIEAAASLIAKNGVEGVSFRTIAAKAGVGHSLITRHFGNKASLVNEVANALVRRLFQDTLDRAGTLATAWNQGLGPHSRTMKALIRILLDSEKQRAAIIEDDFMNDIFHWLRGQVPDGLSADLLRANATLFLTSSIVLGSELIASSFRRNLRLDKADYEEVRREAYRMFAAALRAQRGSPRDTGERRRS